MIRRLRTARSCRALALAATSTLVVLNVLAGASSASASVPRERPVWGDGQAVRVVPLVGASNTLYSQNDHDAGNGIVSEHFRPDPSHYTSRGADDFTVPAGVTWTVTEVDVTGNYRDDYSAAYENVVFFADGGDVPGAVIARFHAVVGNDNGTGSFTIPLGSDVTLGPGRYWVSVRVDERGFWVWETTSVAHDSGAAWKNPLNGFGTGCRHWSNMVSCAGDLGEGPDYMFVLQGTSSGMR